MRTSRAILALALLVASAAVVAPSTLASRSKRTSTRATLASARIPRTTATLERVRVALRPAFPSLPPLFHTCTFPSIANRPRVFPSLGSVEIIPSRAGEGVSRALPRRSLIRDSLVSPSPNFLSGSVHLRSLTKRSRTCPSALFAAVCSIENSAPLQLCAGYDDLSATDKAKCCGAIYDLGTPVCAPQGASYGAQRR